MQLYLLNIAKNAFWTGRTRSPANSAVTLPYFPPLSTDSPAMSVDIAPVSVHTTRRKISITPMRLFNLRAKIVRAGVIPWCIDKLTGERKFWFGVNWYPRELTDFSGAVSKFLDNGDPIHAAYREWMEEGKQAWGLLPISAHRESTVVHDESMLAIFVRVPDWSIAKVKRTFRYNSAKAVRREVSDVVCVTEDVLTRAIFGSAADKSADKSASKPAFPFYSKVVELLSKLTGFDFLK